MLCRDEMVIGGGGRRTRNTKRQRELRVFLSILMKAEKTRRRGMDHPLYTKKSDSSWIITENASTLYSRGMEMMHTQSENSQIHSPKNIM